MAFSFLVEFLVVQEIAFEGSHFGFVEGRGVLSAPKIPDVVFGKQLFFGFGIFEVSGSNQVSHLFKQGFSFVLLAENFDFAQGSVSIQWNGSMEKEVGVGNRIHASVAEDVTDMFA